MGSSRQTLLVTTHYAPIIRRGFRLLCVLLLLAPFCWAQQNLSEYPQEFEGDWSISDFTFGDGKTMIDSTLSEPIYFINLTNSLTINAGSGDDTINVTSLDAGFGARAYHDITSATTSSFLTRSGPANPANPARGCGLSSRTTAMTTWCARNIFSSATGSKWITCAWSWVLRRGECILGFGAPPIPISWMRSCPWPAARLKSPGAIA